MQYVSVPKHEFNDMKNELERLREEYESDFQTAYSRGYNDGRVQAYSEMGLNCIETKWGLLNLNYAESNFIDVEGKLMDISQFEDVSPLTDEELNELGLDKDLLELIQEI